MDFYLLSSSTGLNFLVLFLRLVSHLDTDLRDQIFGTDLGDQIFDTDLGDQIFDTGQTRICNRYLCCLNYIHHLL